MELDDLVVSMEDVDADIFSLRISCQEALSLLRLIKVDESLLLVAEGVLPHIDLEDINVLHFADDWILVSFVDSARNCKKGSILFCVHVLDFVVACELQVELFVVTAVLSVAVC